MAVKPSAPGFKFGVFELDLKAGEPRKQGVKVKLQDQPFQVLAMLLENAGNLVNKDDLQRRIWPADTFVDFDHGLHSAITRLREALGDSSESPRYIETLARRGYRFVAPVTEIGNARGAEATSHQRVTGTPDRFRRFAGSLLAGLFGGAPLLALFLGFNLGGARRWLMRESNPAIRSIAVLPLENLSGDPAQEYFADGMSDAVITDLAKIATLRVVSRTSVMRYKKTQKSAREIAKELNVDAIVEGSIGHTGNRVRISAQLIIGATDQHLWAEAYDRDVSDVLRVQEEIARSIAREIQVKLTPHSGLADCYTVLGVTFGVGSLSSSQVISQARAAAEKAIQLDDSLAEGHSALANTRLFFDWDWAGSEAEFKRALALNPGSSNAHHWYAHLLMAEGRVEEALTESKRALDLDQLSQVTNLHLGWHYIYSRQYDLAIDQLRKTLELDPTYGYAYWYIGRAYEQQGKFAEALQTLRKAQDLLKGNTAVAADIAHLSAISGDKPAALRILEQLKKTPQGTYVSPVEIALIYLALERKAEALQWLEKGYVERSDLLVYLNVDPRLDSLRSDPRFQDLLRRVGLAS